MPCLRSSFALTRHQGPYHHHHSRPASHGASSSSSRMGNHRSRHLLQASAAPKEASGLGTALPHIEQAGCIYLDYNGTTPIFPEVVSAMVPYLHAHGNPSSSHTYGKQCKAAVESARQQVAALVGCAPDELFFTSCGTESDNWAIVGAVLAARRRLAPGSGLPHVVTSKVEHPAVMACLKHLEEQGLATWTAVPVDRAGRVEPSAVVAALTPETVLVTIMHSNNEVGTIQPIAEISAALQQRQQQGQARVLLHTDAAQSMGKVAVDVRALGVDMATVVGHKFGAPKGVAALYVRQGVEICNYFFGGGQEAGRRAGTENVLLLVGLGRAAEIAVQERDALTQHMCQLRDSLQEQLLAALPKDRVLVNGPSEPSQRLPNTLSISVLGLSSSRLLQVLSERLAASAGAACHSHGAAVSSVLAAMGLPTDYAVGTLRLSVGRHSTQADVDRAVELIVEEARAQGVL